jgi:hypothetical protein
MVADMTDETNIAQLSSDLLILTYQLDLYSPQAFAYVPMAWAIAGTVSSGYMP